MPDFDLVLHVPTLDPAQDHGRPPAVLGPLGVDHQNPWLCLALERPDLVFLGLRESRGVVHGLLAQVLVVALEQSYVVDLQDGAVAVLVCVDSHGMARRVVGGDGSGRGVQLNLEGVQIVRLDVPDLV